MNKNPLRENLIPFKKGKSGNPRGRPKLPDLKNLIDEVLGEEKAGKSAAFSILAALRTRAKRGDVRAAELLLDRAYGKAKQNLELSNPTGESFKITLNLNS